MGECAAHRDRAIRSALEQAMADQRVVRIRYTSPDGDTTTRDIEPVLFAATHGQWYLIGWCRLRDAMRWFAVARIARASVTALPCTGHTVAEVGEPPAGARPVHGRVETTGYARPPTGPVALRGRPPRRADSP